MSHKEVSNARHYREHTREQDGWTVLAPPPAAGNDLPPPYTPEADSAPSAAPASTTALPLAFDVPINSNIVGAAKIRQPFLVLANLKFGS
ncbi:hypothetical protein B0H10DRAFT_2232489 [Mycena sp. CBHHK59/15]|nr:hypothetical protein B0H10DRAFT_2232489 [Mycena sp. CBHHK59/15]